MYVYMYARKTSTKKAFDDDAILRTHLAVMKSNSDGKALAQVLVLAGTNFASVLLQQLSLFAGHEVLDTLPC